MSNEENLQEFTLRAGCVLHCDGIPFYLDSDARIRCRPGNWPYIRIGTTRNEYGRSIHFDEETGRYVVSETGQFFDPDSGTSYYEDCDMDCDNGKCSPSDWIDRAAVNMADILIKQRCQIQESFASLKEVDLSLCDSHPLRTEYCKDIY